MAEDERCGLTRRQGSKGRQEIMPLGDPIRIAVTARSMAIVKEPGEALPPAAADRDVHRDAMHPRLGGCLGSPAVPGPVCAHKGFLGAILGLGRVAKQRQQHRSDARKRLRVQAVEIGLIPRPVLTRSRIGRTISGPGLDSPCVAREIHHPAGPCIAEVVCRWLVSSHHVKVTPPLAENPSVLLHFVQ